MRYHTKLLRLLRGMFLIFLCLTLFSAAQAQNVKRIVILKFDGLPYYLVDKFVKQRNPATGKSELPWFDEIFYKNGARLENFYVRGMSLSGPAWSVLDTGQHLQIKGNVEYDRYTLHAHDYLNFLPLQINYGLKKQIDMPGVEVLDQLKVPLLSDAFEYQNRYTSFQLIQRGNSWGVLGSGFIKFFPRKPAEFLDEWTIGFNLRDVTVDQNERDIISKLAKRPDIQYLDFFSGTFDHVSHHNNDVASRLEALKEIDRTIGRIWMGIQSSAQAAETAMVVVSDHGFNSDEKVYSQGFNIVKLLASQPGGGHHVVTKRRLMLDYSLKGAYPIPSLITTTSNESFYLKGQSDAYPTALVDFDGNERTSFHLRNSDLNILHILLQQLQSGKLSAQIKQSTTDYFFDVINRNRARWQTEIGEIKAEMDALHRQTEARQQEVAAQPKKYTPEEIAVGIADEAVRLAVQTNIAVEEEKTYREYVRTVSNLLALDEETFDAKKIKIEDYIAKGAMGDRNSVYQLQNYVVGLSNSGLILNGKGTLDFDKSFQRVNYFDLLEEQKVRNNVQPGISNRPIDFVSTRVSLEGIAGSLAPDQKPDESPIWIYGGDDKQALILTRTDADGNQLLKYLPIADLKQDASGRYTFQIKQWSAGLPLKIYEDENFNVPAGADKTAWLNNWHTETEWIRATHKTVYSIGVVSLNEQLDEHPFVYSNNMSDDEKLIFRFRQRQRALTEADVLVLANNHWNFDVRGFNPGGNHGSFFRVSTNSTMMIAGGEKTKISRGLAIEEPYESLSFAPTILRLMGMINENGEPTQQLYQKGFRKFPGRIIKELIQH